MNYQRLEQLEKDLRSTSPIGFHMRRWSDGAIGVFCRLHPTWTLQMKPMGCTAVPFIDGHEGNRAVEKYFGLSQKEATHIFSPEQYLGWPDEDVGPREVANRIATMLMGDADEEDFNAADE